MINEKLVRITMWLPVNVELTVEPLETEIGVEDFDVKDVRILDIQSVSVSDVNENMRDDDVQEVLGQINEE